MYQSIFIVVLINLFFILATIMKIPNNYYLKNSFLLFLIIIEIWLICHTLLYIYQTIFFLKLAYSAVILSVIPALVFINNFINSKIISKKQKIIISIFCLILVIMCILPNFFFKVMNNNEGNIEEKVKFTVFYNIFSFFMAGNIIYLLINLFKIIKNESDENKKMQAKYIFLGFLIYALAAFIFTGILPVFFHIFFMVKYIFYTPIIFIGLAFYAIISVNFREKEKLKSEMVVAEQIQTAILPKLNYNYQDLEIDAIMKPAEQVGGDYYDIITDKKNDLWLAIGDVTGHGITSGIISMIAQTCLMTNLLENIAKSTYEVILSINNTLHENIRNRLHESHFMTFSLLKYFGDGEFEQSGSHLDIIIYRNETKECEIIKTEGVYLGIMNRAENAIMTKRFKLQQDDIMILFTDGITEARNENQKCINQNFIYDILKKTQNITLIKNLVLQKSLDWCNNKQDDDMTLIIVKRR